MLASLLFSRASEGYAEMSSVTSKPTLYDRLGGVYSIAAVVDDFIDRVMHNPVLNANAAVDEAHHRVSAAGFKYYVTEMVCWATGGPQSARRASSTAHAARPRPTCSTTSSASTIRNAGTRRSDI